MLATISLSNDLEFKCRSMHHNKTSKQNNLTYVSSKERKKEQNIKQNLGYLEMLL